MLLPQDEQRRFVSAMQEVAPGRGFRLFTYCIASPLSAEKREVWTPFKLPPVPTVVPHSVNTKPQSHGEFTWLEMDTASPFNCDPPGGSENRCCHDSRADCSLRPIRGNRI